MLIGISCEKKKRTDELKKIIDCLTASLDRLEAEIKVKSAENEELIAKLEKNCKENSA